VAESDGQALRLRRGTEELCDHYRPVPVLTATFAAVTLLAVLTAFELPLIPIGTVGFLGLAATLGIGTGAVFALVARLVEPDRVGAVTGLVGAAGGLGGFVPPLIMGYVYGHTESYAIGLWMLSITAALTLLLTVTVVRQTARGRQQE
jgi:NNP family nitrate/nitrite transporter-like MFS transporter